jgi:methylmalonyl-CoA mutase
MNKADLTLAADFPPCSYEQWKTSVVDKELKGAPFDKRMVTRTADGLAFQPLYVAENWPSAGDPSGFPGCYPFVRGDSTIARTGTGWDIRQEFREPDPKAANREIRHDLARGVTSVVLRLDQAARAGAPASAATAGIDGVIIHDLAGLEEALEGVDLAATPVVLEAGAAFQPAALALAALWQKRGVAAATGEFSADPLGHLAATGALPYSLDQGLAQLGALAAWTAQNFPKVRSAVVDTTPYHHAGASEVHDLGIALATAVAYLKAMEAAGLDIDSACQQLSFTLAVGCEEYLQIAKLRAARKLFAALATACGASKAAATTLLRAKSAERMFTRVDPWVNLLRTSVAVFAAAVGGADSMTSLPFDDAIGLPDDLGRRLARNTQIILMEESNLYRVADPAGGSYALESLTQDLADRAWAFFQEIEAKGGIQPALESGFLHEAIQRTMAERDKDIARRKVPVTGVSEFPNILETQVERPAPDCAAAIQRSVARIAAAPVAAPAPGNPAPLLAAVKQGAAFADLVQAGADAPATLAALPQRRLGDRFEQLRDAANAHQAKTGSLPSIFLANLGPVAQHTGRASFAKNFFEAGGIRTLGNDGFTEVEACVRAFRASGARIAILCSADALYEQLVPTFGPALKAAGAETLYLAGAPGDKQEIYDAAGVDAYISLGGEVLGVLTAQLARLGVVAQ